MFRTLVLCFLASFSISKFTISAAQAKTSAAADAGPNVILILADDLGYGDIGSYGQDKIKTPNLDRMATEGVQFTQFYSGSAVCRPARCTLMTGLHTGNCYVRANNYQAGLNLRLTDVTIAEVLKEKNFTTATIGKWALGEENSTGIPTKQGFDYFYGYLNQTHAHNYYPEFLIRNTDRVPLSNQVPNAGQFGEGIATVKQEYSNDLFTEEALNFIRENKDNPFFLYLPYTLPHANNEAGDMGLEVPDLGIYENMDWPHPRKAYAAMVTRLDSYVGSIIEELKRQNLENNTIILFTSDNGPHEESGHDPSFFNSTSNLRGLKRNFYEGGIRVPLIVWGPGIVKSNSVSDHISYFPDILPTIAEAIGIEIEHSIDGLSFYPTLTAATESQKEHKFLYWEAHEKKGARALRIGNWKSVIKPYRGKMELYDLSNDVIESNNIASENADILSVHKEIIEQAHTSLPLVKASQVFLIREQISKTKVVVALVFLTGLLLVSGYIIVWKKRNLTLANRRKVS